MTNQEQSAGGSAGLRLGLVLGGGAARGLAHVGVLEVLEGEGVRPSVIAGSSMGGLVAALWAAGVPAREIAMMAREFRFPRWFVPGATITWESIFGRAKHVLAPLSFDELSTPLRLTAADIEHGVLTVLDRGPLLAAVRATCAVPGVMPPERIDGRWLVDGGVLSMVPVDVAWAADPDVVVAVSVGARHARPMPRLGWKATTLAWLLGRILPNPVTAKISFEILVRAAEIALGRRTVLSSAMAPAEVLIEVDVDDIGLRDFHRVDEAVARGRAAAAAALPSLHALLATRVRAPGMPAASGGEVDPVCGMTLGARRARAHTEYMGRSYGFCSETCRDVFLRRPDAHVPAALH